MFNFCVDKIKNYVPAVRGDWIFGEHLRLNRKLKKASVMLLLEKDKADDWKILVTRRSMNLRINPGQLCLPGGSIDDSDIDHIQAALRETEEEVGIKPEYIEIIGELDTYEAVIGFEIFPVVALFKGDHSMIKCLENEVSDYCWLSLDKLYSSVQIKEILWHGANRKIHEMKDEENIIWGGTAGIIMNFFETQNIQHLHT